MERTSKKKQIISTTILIVGAGLVGSIFSAALARAGIKNIVVDLKKIEALSGPGLDGRASALAFASKNVLDSIGLWDNLSEKAAPILQIRVSEKNSFNHIHFDHKDIGEDPFGFMLENYAIRCAQAEFFNNNTFSQLIAPTRVKGLIRDEKRVTAILENGTTIHARLVVAADGRNSQMREMANIGITKWRYNQNAIVCNVEHEKSHNFIAHEHFLPSGPFAILPLIGSSLKPHLRSAIVWIDHPDLTSVFKELPDVEFLFELKRRFGDFLGELRVVSNRWHYPLKLQYAETSIANRLALIGDAAHGMHPIAGQGLNMGIRDAAALAEVITDGLRFGKDIGGKRVLSEYQRLRRFDNTLMLAATDNLNRLFSNNVSSIKLLRGLGLGAVNKMPWLKRKFMRYAMGNLANAPRLMRGLDL